MKLMDNELKVRFIHQNIIFISHIKSQLFFLKIKNMLDESRFDI